MLGRNMDYKIKLLKENGFSYTGDKYSHECGLDIWCYKIRNINDENFEIMLKDIMKQIERLNKYKEGIFLNCNHILEKKYIIDFAGSIK